MDFNTMLEKLNWKKIFIVIGIVVFAMWIVREIMFWSYFHEATRMFAQFNTQFDQQQNAIHKKITEDESEFDKRHKAFNELFDKTEKTIDDVSKEFKKTSQELDKQALEREKKFDEAFAKAPQQMLEQHKAMSEKMFNEFKKEVQSR